MNLVECSKCKKFVDDERCTKIAVLENCKYKRFSYICGNTSNGRTYLLTKGVLHNPCL